MILRKGSDPGGDPSPLAGPGVLPCRTVGVVRTERTPSRSQGERSATELHPVNAGLCQLSYSPRLLQVAYLVIAWWPPGGTTEPVRADGTRTRISGWSG